MDGYCSFAVIPSTRLLLLERYDFDMVLQNVLLY
jgi:hypothetical protein